MGFGFGKLAFGRILGGPNAPAIERKPWFVDLRKDADSQATWQGLDPLTRGRFQREGLGMGGNVVVDAWEQDGAVAAIAKRTGVPAEILEAIGST